jgi:hypothetical protein
MEMRRMTAPSSEQEGQQIAAEIEARPNLRIVTEKMLALIETLEPGRRRESLEAVVACLDVGLPFSQDLSDEERDQWLQVLIP